MQATIRQDDGTTTPTTTVFTCDRCKQEITHVYTHTTGYGTTKDGKKNCFACCGAVDREDMQRTGKATLYLVGSSVSNWPGTLKYSLTFIRKGRHNLAGVRYDVWFNDEHGKTWHGVQYGDFTQICHCKRAK